MIKTLEAQVGQFLLGCKCPVNRDIIVQEQGPLGDLTEAFFLQNVLQLHQQRRVILSISAHEQASLSNDTIDSVLRHREVGRAKNLSASPRICVILLKFCLL